MGDYSIARSIRETLLKDLVITIQGVRSCLRGLGRGGGGSFEGGGIRFFIYQALARSYAMPALLAGRGMLCIHIYIMYVSMVYRHPVMSVMIPRQLESVSFALPPPLRSSSSSSYPSPPPYKSSLTNSSSSPENPSHLTARLSHRVSVNDCRSP